MAYQLIDGDPDESTVRQLTFVLFRPDGRCVLRPGRRLPTGTVLPGEHFLLDSCLRIPRQTVGFHPQRVHPYAADGTHLYVWADGDLLADHPADVVIADGADLVPDAVRSFTTQSEASYYADNVRLLEPAYLRGTTAQAGSGSSGDAARWRARREMIVDGLDRDGTFLDVGCANGLLMESVHEWAAERGLAIEPYGVDLAPRLAALARQRLPRWADRIEVGNAIDYLPAGGRRFTFVHVLFDAVPVRRRADLIRHALTTLVEPGGRLLASQYQSGPSAGEVLRGLGFDVAGNAGANGASTAWLRKA